MKLKKIILGVSLLLCAALILCSCFKLDPKPDSTDKPETRATEQTTPPETTPEETTTPEPTTSPEQAVAGEYEMFALAYEGILVEPMAFDLVSTIQLKDDMTGSLIGNGDTTNFTWSLNPGSIIMKIAGEEVTGDIYGDVINIDFGEGTVGLYGKAGADLSGYTVLTAEEFFENYYYDVVYTNIIHVSPEDTIAEDGDFYSTRFGFSLLTDNDIINGWYYSYSTGTDDVVPDNSWETSSGMHTSGSFGIVVYNDNDNMAETFTSRFLGIVVFNEPDEFEPGDPFNTDYLDKILTDHPETEVYVMIPLFANPGQTTDNGKQAYSTDARIIEKGEGGYLSAMFDMSEDAYQSLMDRDDSHVMTIYFTFGGDTLYVADAHEFFNYFCEDYE